MLSDFYTQQMNLAEKSPHGTQIPLSLIFWMLIPKRFYTFSNKVLSLNELSHDVATADIFVEYLGCSS